MPDTSGLFGAPIGIMAAEDQINQNVLTGVKALQAFGEIAAQPAELELKRAHARYYGAEAAKAEAATASDAFITANAPAIFASVAAGKGGSIADPMLAMARLQAISGNPTKAIETLSKASGVIENEAQTDAARNLSAKRQLDMQSALVDRVGSAAASVVDQQSYDRARMTLLGSKPAQAALAGFGLTPEDLPPDFASAQPLLQQLVTQSMKAKDAVKARQDAIDLADKMKRRATQNKLTGAKAVEAEAHTDLLKERTTKLKKEGGDGSPLTQEAKKALIESRKTASAVREAKLYPRMTPEEMKDPRVRQIGQTYTLPTGRYTWAGQGWIAAAKSAPAAAPAESTDDNEEE